MNTNKYLFGTLAVVIAVLIPHNTAHAGLTDWFGILKGSDTTAEDAWSLDSFYALIRTDGTNDAVSRLANAVTVSEDTVSALPSLTTATAKPATAKRTLSVVASGYSSTPDQTDDTPFITAKGTYVRDGIIATNILPFGTLVKIPAIYGDKIFVVEDRMNRRYQNNIDIWFPDRQTALEFGRKTVEIEIL